MGYSVPEFPPIDPDLYYQVDVDYHLGTPPNCEGVWVADRSCCVLGSQLQAFINDGDECQPAKLICGFIAFTVQKITGWSGGWDTIASCQAQL